MRQLARGVLATLVPAVVLSMAACGGGDAGEQASSDEALDGAALAAASEISTPDEVVAGPASLTIAVTSPEGVGSPGLDAAVSVLLGRPDTQIEVVAPAADVSADVDGRTDSVLAPVRAETMTGHGAEVVNGSMLDVVDALFADADTPDLVLIGFVSHAGESSAAMRAAREVAGRGTSVLVVDVGGEEPDLGGAGLLLTMVADYDLDALLAEPDVHVLTVPACDAGTVRGPVVVEASPVDEPPPPIDCTSPDVGPFDDEHEAWAAGHATLARHDPDHAIP